MYLSTREATPPAKRYQVPFTEEPAITRFLSEAKAVAPLRAIRPARAATDNSLVQLLAFVRIMNMNSFLWVKGKRASRPLFAPGPALASPAGLRGAGIRAPVS